jgi:hypothetical protein
MMMPTRAGIRHDFSQPGNNSLLVLDAYRGLLRIDTASGDKMLVFDSHHYGQALVNDLDVSPDGRIGENLCSCRFGGGVI